MPINAIPQTVRDQYAYVARTGAPAELTTVHAGNTVLDIGAGEELAYFAASRIGEVTGHVMRQTIDLIHLHGVITLAPDTREGDAPINRRGEPIASYSTPLAVVHTEGTAPHFAIRNQAEQRIDGTAGDPHGDCC